MNSATIQLEIDASELQCEQADVSPLTVDQLVLIAGGECVVNSI
jgi:hypothetical protein